jgi:DNA-binding protein YbaB
MTAMRYDNVELPAVGLPRAKEQLRTSTFLGRDQENLVTAVVDGDGIVDTITFANTAAARRPQVVAAAVLAAIADARSRAIDALMELTMARDSTATNDRASVDGIVGGPVDQPHGGS